MTSATDNRTTELLPCPFCSSEPDLLESYGGWYIRCSCGVSMCENYSEGGFPVGEFVTEAEAIAAWNTRAELVSEINGETSDGYHTFNELYHHRAVLFSVIVRDHRELAWKARKHHDGTMYEGMIFGRSSDKPDADYCPSCGAKVVS